MLLAVETPQFDEDGNRRNIVDVVPCDDCFIQPDSRGFIMCLSSEDAQRQGYLHSMSFSHDCFLPFRLKNYCSICCRNQEYSSKDMDRMITLCRHGIELTFMCKL